MARQKLEDLTFEAAAELVDAGDEAVRRWLRIRRLMLVGQHRRVAVALAALAESEVQYGLRSLPAVEEATVEPVRSLPPRGGGYTVLAPQSAPPVGDDGDEPTSEAEAL